MVIVDIKPRTSLSRILDLAEENALPYRSDDDQFSVTLYFHQQMPQVILHTKTQTMRMEQERSAIYQGACFSPSFIC